MLIIFLALIANTYMVSHPASPIVTRVVTEFLDFLKYLTDLMKLMHIIKTKQLRSMVGNISVLPFRPDTCVSLSLAFMPFRLQLIGKKEIWREELVIFVEAMLHAFITNKQNM